MLRRTFAKTLLASCSLPFWPFPQIKEQISNSDLIKRLLKEGKDFCIITEKNGLVVNIIRQKHRFNATEAVTNRLNSNLSQTEPPQVRYNISELLKRKEGFTKQRWYKLKVLFGKKPE